MKSPVKFGKYYLLERVNVGGMAEIFKAKSFGEAGFERLVAVKRILPAIAEDQEFIAMFIDEAKLAVQLTHPNIAQIFELGKVGEAYFIALEYVAGRDLRSIFDKARKRNEPLPIPMACYIVMKICEGLDYAHNKKDAAGRNLELVHRDVSPQNMLLSYDGDVKLIDFGIAKAASKSSKTQAGILKGKFGYMSPEQVRGLSIDRRSDVFAVGIVLYELLTMERLFASESDFSTLEKVRNADIMPPTTYNRKIPEELEHIVLKALARQPEDRYRTAMDLHDDLQSFMYTSGNFFARKDLSTYMHRMFNDEIAKENAKDDEYRKFDARKASDLEVFDGAQAPGAKGIPSPTARASTPPPPPPNRKATMLGVGMNAAAAQAQAQAQAGPVNPKATLLGTGPSANAAVAAAVARANAANAANGGNGAPALDMDWDDEELATQVYDKPGKPGRDATPDEPRAAPSKPPATQPVPAPRSTTAAAIPAPAPKSLPPIPAPPPPGPAAAPAVGAPAFPPPAATAPMPGLAVGAPVMPLAVPPPTAPRPPGNNGFAMGPPTGPAVPLPYGQAHPPTPLVQQPERGGNPVVFLLAGLGVAAIVGLMIGGYFLMNRPPPSGSLAISTNVPDVNLEVDSQPQVGNGMSFAVSNLQAGRTHHITARRNGYHPREMDVPVRENEITPVQIVLDPVAPQVAANPPPVPTPPPVLPTPTPTPTPPTPTPNPNPTGLVAVNTPPTPPVVNPTGQVPLVPIPPPNPNPTPSVGPSNPPRPTPRPRPRVQENPEPRIARTNPPNPPTPPPTPPASGGNGTLSISTRPASRCTVAGQTFSTPRLRLSLPAGTHRVSCQNTEFNVSANFTVTIRGGEETREINHPLN